MNRNTGSPSKKHGQSSPRSQSCEGRGAGSVHNRRWRPDRLSSVSAAEKECQPPPAAGKEKADAVAAKKKADAAAARAKASVAPVRVGGNIRAPTKIKDVKPVYPAIAQSARVAGAVTIEATIGPDGKVIDAKVVRSIPLLDQAALDAVRQWEYTPTLLNGVPVPVLVTVTINFTRQ